MNIINTINPWYITGFSDGESTFSFSINKKEQKQNGIFRFQIVPQFAISAADNPENKKQLESIIKFFGVGKIYTEKSKVNDQSWLRYRVLSIQDCLIIRKHFEKYSLLTDKGLYFIIWCKVLDLIINKEHLTEEGLNKIVALKTQSPKGVSSKLEINFPNYKNYLDIIPKYTANFTNINIHWLAGFINADGSFKVEVLLRKTGTLGKQVRPLIVISQHTNNLIVLNKIKEFLGIGNITIRKTQPLADFKITSLKESNNFIKLFKEAKLLGAKALDYNDFCHNINLMNHNKHLTKAGIAEIEFINSKLNSKRSFSD